MYYKLNIKGKIVPAINVYHPAAIKRNHEYVDLINNAFNLIENNCSIKSVRDINHNNYVPI